MTCGRQVTKYENIPIGMYVPGRRVQGNAVRIAEIEVHRRCPAGEHLDGKRAIIDDGFGEKIDMVRKLAGRLGECIMIADRVEYLFQLSVFYLDEDTDSYLNLKKNIVCFV